MHSRTPKEVLEELNKVMDSLIKDMVVWEERLRGIVEAGNRDGAVDVAGEGSNLSRRSEEVRATLDENRVQRPDDEDQRRELDELDAEIETKCDIVSEKIQNALEQIYEIKDDLNEGLERTKKQIDDLDIYLDPDED